MKNVKPTVPITPELQALARDLERSNVRHRILRLHPELSMSESLRVAVDLAVPDTLRSRNEIFSDLLDTYGQPL